MDRQQAIQEIIKLKKQYDPNVDKNVMMQNKAMADQLRQQYGIDEKMYGSGVSLADAYSNYAREFGHNVNQPRQQQTPQQTQQQIQQSSFNQEEQMRQLQEMMMQNSSSYFDAQKAQFDKMLNDQLTQLEMAYAEAVNQGQLSVREAQQQFEEQKKQIEQQAYLDSERTNAMAQHRGIQNSQQMIGLMQGDNARKNAMLNTNASDRDKRINDIRDRINLITQQKDLDMARAQSEYGYNIAGAQAQAQQMYAQQMGQFVQQDYFNQQGYQHDYNMLDKQNQYSKELQNLAQKNDLAKMATQFGYDLQKMDKDQINKIEIMNTENKNAIQRMGIQHDFDLQKIGVEFANQLKAIDRQAGHQASLAAANRSHEAKMMEQQNKEKRDWFTFQMNENMKLANSEYEKELERQLKGVTPGTKEYKLIVETNKRDFNMKVQNDINTMLTIYSLEQIMYNPLFGKTIKKPTLGQEIGNILNPIPGIFRDTPYDKYLNQLTDQSMLYDKFGDKFGNIYNNTQGVIDGKFNQPGSNEFNDAVKRYIEQNKKKKK